MSSAAGERIAAASLRLKVGPPALVDGYPLVTNANGEFTLPPLPRSVLKPNIGYRVNARGWDAQRGVVALDTFALEGLHIELEEASAVTGRTVDRGGRPVAGAIVLVGRLRAVANAQGIFRLESVPRDTAEFLVIPSGHSPRFVQIPPLRDAQVDIGDVLLEAGEPIRGVARLPNGELTGGFFVVARLRSGGRVVRRAVAHWRDGTFSLPNLNSAVILEVEPDSRGSIDVRLASGTEISVPIGASDVRLVVTRPSIGPR